MYIEKVGKCQSYLFYYKQIFITMIYNEKIQMLLESLDGKLRILQNGISGAQHLSPSEAHTTLEDARKIVERISELTRINR